MEFVLNHSRTENLSVLWENFSLSEHEGNKYQVYEKGYEGKFLLAAKFFAGRAQSREAVAGTFKLL